MMMDTNKPIHTASPVARVNKGRVPELGRGSGSINLLQSPIPGTPTGETGTKDTGANGQPSGATSASTSASVKQAFQGADSGLVISKSTDPSSRGANGSGQRHTGVGLPGAKGMTKNQKRRMRKKMTRITHVTAGGSEAGFKRPWSEISTPSPNVQTAQKKPREEVQPRKEVQSRREVQPRKDDQPGEGAQTGKDCQPGSSSQALRTTKIVIVKRHFPSDMLSLEESEGILREVLELTDSIPIGCKMPEIFSNNLMNGALVFQCSIATVEWIRINFNNRVLGGLALRVLSADELPKPVKVAFKTKEKFSDQSVLLRRLQRLNPELKSEGWRILQFVPGPTTCRSIFEVDPEDVKAIRRANFGAFTGVDRGIFKIIHDPNRKTPVEVKPTVPVVPSAPTETSDSVEPPIPHE